MKRLTPFFWFASDAEEAAQFYVSIFPNSKVSNVVRYGPGGPGLVGSAMTVSFQLDGESFVALNGQQAIPPSAAISFVINCTTQDEVDHFWDKLGAGGKIQQCGWLSDKFGLSWQVCPADWVDVLTGDKDRANRAMAAVYSMTKFDLAAIEAAADGV